MVKQQGGFTLIELVLVIVILGILAATALPRFSSLSQNACQAAVSGLGGAIRSAAAIAHATQLATNTASGGVLGVVTMDGVTVQLQNGYPTFVGLGNALTDTTGFVLEGLGYAAACGGTKTAAACGVQYTASGANGAFPLVSVTSTGC